MKPIAIVMTAAALVALGGCNRSGGTANASVNTAGASNAAAANSAAAKPGDSAGTQSAAAGSTPAAGANQVDRAYLVGRWTDDGNCANAMELAQDGRFTTKDGGGGLWNLEGDEVTLSGGRTLSVRVAAIDHNTITIIHPDGSLGRSTRC